MKSAYDAIIIGGGIIGLSTAYHLSRSDLSVLVLDKEYPGSGSSGRCIGGIRQQFSTESSIKLMQESMSHFKRMEEEFGFSVEFSQGGYLFLAHEEKTLESFKKVAALQKNMGLNIQILSRSECKKVVPQMDIEGLLGGVYSPDDGQAYPFHVMRGYMEGIRKSGSDIKMFSTVENIVHDSSGVKGVTLATGETIHGNIVVNTAGPWAADVGRMVGLRLPIMPEEHEALITTRMDHLFDPMIVDYRPDGCYFQQMVTGQIIGCYSPDPQKPGTHTESSLEFLIEMSKRTVRLVPSLKHAQILRHWGGSYCMTPDGSPIIDQTSVRGFYTAAGMSGHGFMFAPAVGKYMSAIITRNEYPFDWDEFKLERDFSREEVMK
jgi:sarcosine oxidase subunit beta